jgi:Zn-dependent M28 family amino/carboxypeptidase
VVLLLACALLACAAPSSSEEAAAAASGPLGEVGVTAAALRDRALEENRAWDFLESLVVEVGPRFAGTEGNRRAVAWAEAKLRALGFDEVHTEPVTVPAWKRGTAAGAVVSPYPQPMVVAALGGSVATPDGGLTAEVVRVTSLDAIDALSEAETAGKIVFIDQRMARSRDGSGYGQTVGIRGQGAVRAARRGAAAVLIRSVGTDQERVAHTGGMRYDDAVTKIPAAALSNPDADTLALALERTAASGEPLRFRLELTTRREPDAPSANVIGEIRGRERPEEIVLLACHLDSWDLGQGAVDDGAGCAIVVEAARLIAQLPQRPRRTLRVVLFANEEFGLSGARAYAELHAAEQELHVAGMEADLGAGAVWRFESRVAAAQQPTVNAIAELLAPLEIAHSDNEARGGADLSPLRPLGLPIFDLDQDATLYFDVHHTLNDTLANVDREGLAQNVAAYVTVAYCAAELGERFQRLPADG